MLDRKNLLSGFTLDEKTIKVKAWESLGDNEVKVRKLSVKESSEINSILFDGAEPKDGQYLVQIDKLKKAQIATVNYALVEPSLTRNELERLSDEAHEGIAEIYTEVMNFDKEDLGK